jgi:hypothetical protein
LIDGEDVRASTMRRVAEVAAEISLLLFAVRLSSVTGIWLEEYGIAMLVMMRIGGISLT